MKTVIHPKFEDPYSKTNQLLQHMVEGVKDYAIFLLDSNGYITSWNAGAERIKGYHAEEIIGRNFSCFYTNDDLESKKPEHALETAFREGRFEDIGWRVRKDGSQFWAHVIITPVFDSDGIFQGFTKITRDLTEQRRSEERFKGILESAPDAIVIADSDGKIQMINAQTENLFGYSRNEIIGQEVELLIPQRFHEGHYRHRQNYNLDPKVRAMGIGMELYGVRKDGKEFPVEISLSPIRIAEEEVLVFAAVRDITRQKKAESEIKQLNKELESFSYSVSHDLRAPLRSIDGFSNLILKKYSDLLDEQGKDYFMRVMHASQQMGHLIDDLLKLSRITRIEVNKKITDLSEMAETIAAELKSSQPGRNAAIHIQPDMIANVDRNLMQIALHNLFDNAWKYSRNQSSTKIEFGTLMQENKTVYFIRDNGVGFDMKYVDKLFGVFQRLHSTTEFEGTGIGLATVQRIIRSTLR